MTTLVSHGARGAIGDFGIGLANFDVLQQLPFDAVRFGQPLVAQVSGNTMAAQTFATLIGLAQLAGLETTASGVERPEQLKVVADAGCQIGQGFHFAGSMDPGELRAYLQR